MGNHWVYSETVKEKGVVFVSRTVSWAGIPDLRISWVCFLVDVINQCRDAITVEKAKESSKLLVFSFLAYASKHPATRVLPKP